MRLAKLALCLLIAAPTCAAGQRLPRGVVVVLPDTPREDPTAAQPAPVQDILRGPPAPHGLLGGGAVPRPVVLPVLPEIPPEPRDPNWPPPDDTIEVEDLAPPASELGG
jgi:hypothetical protein